VADGQVARKPLQDLLVKDLGHQTQTPVLVDPAAVPGDDAAGLLAPVLADPAAVAGDDAAGLLAPVLQGIEAEIGEAGRVGMAVDAENAAVFPGMVVQGCSFTHLPATSCSCKSKLS
jgi:hypothetical protein